MFFKQKNELQIKLTDLKAKLRHTEDRAEKWLDLTEKTFNFATYAHIVFLRANEMGMAGLQLTENPYSPTRSEALAVIRTRCGEHGMKLELYRVILSEFNDTRIC